MSDLNTPDMAGFMLSFGWRDVLDASRMFGMHDEGTTRRMAVEDGLFDTVRVLIF